ncbi:MAG TPA: hypothetical protein PKK12_08070, partial [Candidatus Aminicenantes bacterium]|nr:hypothetical protein [Candidatus Aminicenantes bacterium]
GWLLVSGWDRIVRPVRWPRFPFTFDLVPAESLRGGLEITLSRGCHFRCSFCCKLQGAARRRLSLLAVERLLATYRAQLDRDPSHGAQARHVNINDDDLLQDPEYARKVFSLLLRHRLELAGVQTSLATLDTLHRQGGLTMLTRPALFAGGRPLLWIGSDTFLVERGRRLRKPVLAPARLEALLAELDRNAIAHHHYWISSDADSTWPEFIREFLLLIRLLTAHPQMGLLPHAPFVIPYVGTELHRRAIDSGQQAQIVTRGIVAAADPRFAWPLAGRLETRYPGLNRLLRGEAGQRGPAFLRALAARDFLAAIQPVFHALGQERRSAEERGEVAFATELRQSEDQLADEASRRV